MQRKKDRQSELHFIDCQKKTSIFEIFKSIEQNSTNCFLFESLGTHDAATRYTIIGFNPDYIVSANDHQVICDGKIKKTKNPYNFLRSLIALDSSNAEHFTGGLVGYLAYDAINYFEPSLNVQAHPDFDQFMFGMYTDGLVYDKLTGELKYFYRQQNRIDLVQKILKQKPKKITATVQFIKNGLSQQQHATRVKQILAEVTAGNTFQTQLGFKRHYTCAGDHLAIYQELRKVNPSPYMFYIKHQNKTLMGASPELLFKLQHNHMETFPLAGTIRRGKNNFEDQQLAQELLHDPKEIAEHNMLVDLHRNDLGRVAKFGSVRVQKLKDIKKFSHVQHISSEVVGTLKNSEDMFSALASNFPAGTLSGAPKIESMKIINRVESEPRGPYGGAVGYFGIDGNCSFCIPIRSLFIAGEQGFTQASGGVVYDSQPKQEYQEILNKLAAFDQVLNKFKD